MVIVDFIWILLIFLIKGSHYFTDKFYVILNKCYQLIFDKSDINLTMKGTQSPDIHCSSLNQSSSRLNHIRRTSDDNVEKFNIDAVKNIAEEHLSSDVLKEMENRVKSRMEIYDNEDTTDKLSESLHSFSFVSAPSPLRNSSLNQTSNLQSSNPNQSLNASWQFYKFVGAEENNEVMYNGAHRKPSEAIFTIDAKTSKILVANQTACRLFGYKDEVLCGGMKIYNLFTMEDGIKQEIFIERDIEKDGNIVMASGKILEAVDVDGHVFVVSVWMKRIQSGKNPRCVVILEQVEVTKAAFLFDAEGIIKDCDFQFAFLHGYEDPQDMVNTSLFHLIPSLVLPVIGKKLEKNIKKQRVTSRTKDMVPFPATIKLKEHSVEDHQSNSNSKSNNDIKPSKLLYKGFMWVFANISGLVTVKPNGSIKSCNSNFVRMFLGHNEKELIGKNITQLVPYFFEQIDLLCDENLRIESKHHEYDSKGIHSPRGKVNQKRKKSSNNDPLKCKNDPDITLSDHEQSLESISTIEECEKLHSSIDNDNNDTHHHSNIETCSIQNNDHLKKTKNENNDPKHTKKSLETDIKIIDTEDFEDSVLALPAINPSINNKIPSPQKHDQEIIDDTVFDLPCPEKSTPNLNEKPLKLIDTELLNSPSEKQILKFDSNLMKNECTSSSPLTENVDHFLDNLLSSSEHSMTHQHNEEEPPKKENINKKDLRNINQTKTSDYSSLGSSTSSDSRFSNEKQLSTILNSINSNVYNSLSPIQNDSLRKGEASMRNTWLKNKPSQQIVPGLYYGQAKHKDGSLLPIIFEIKHISSKQNENFFCIWISRDPEEEGECCNEQLEYLSASYNSTMNASAGNFQELMKSMNKMTVEDPGRGPYNNHFSTLNCIGKGAFGFVNLAEKKSTKEQVIVKFVRKEKVLKDSWIDDDKLGVVPFEVYLLAQLDHPNVVRMLEAYENEDFFQIVMEKHGEGIDLFEFIDRKPRMDEALASYMYRQVLQATEYLYSKNILHRDIKDENIIVDRQFNLKLIDFGSAAYMKPGKLFNTFCGTVEYCSPEVLLGNWYEGPELEMWSIGVTLYTFIFGEHPFFEVEETIRAELFPPFKVSNELMFIVCWMLHPQVDFRSKIKDVITYPWFTRPVDINKYNYEFVLGAGNDHPDGGDNIVNNGGVSKKVSFSSSSTSSTSSSCTDLSSSNFTDTDDNENNSQTTNDLRKEYQKYLADPSESETINAMLSKSF